MAVIVTVQAANFATYIREIIKKGIDTNIIKQTEKFYDPIEKNKNGTLQIKSGQMVYVCFSSDFLIEDADNGVLNAGK